MRKEDGNAIWFILLAVALLGFLTSVISRSTSSVDQTGSAEDNRVRVSSTIKYAQGVELAVQNLRLNNGCSENEISFESGDFEEYENNNAPEDMQCHVFSRKGGALNWKTYGYDTKEWLISTGAQIDESPENDRDDIIMILRDVSKEFCTQANLQLHEWSEIPDWSLGTNDLWEVADGDFENNGLKLTLPSSGEAWDTNVTAGCFFNSAIEEYDFFYTVLLR